MLCNHRVESGFGVDVRVKHRIYIMENGAQNTQKFENEIKFKKKQAFECEFLRTTLQILAIICPKNSRIVDDGVF